MKRILFVLFAVLAVVGAACSSDDSADDAAATTTAPATTELPAATTAASEAPPETSSPTVPESCTPASDSDLQTITAGLRDGATSLAHGFTMENGEGRLVAANIFDAESARLSSADYWLFGADGEVFSISSSAEDYSTFARHPDGPSIAGGEDASELTDCVVAQLRMENLGG